MSRPVPALAPGEGYLFISFQQSFTSVFQMSADTPIHEKNNPTFKKDLVKRMFSIMVKSSLEGNQIEEIVDNVAQLVSSYHLRNNIKKLFVIHAGGITVSFKTDRHQIDKKTFEAPVIEKALLLGLNQRKGTNIKESECLMEPLLYSQIANLEPSSQFAVVCCTMESTYVDKPKKENQLIVIRETERMAKSQVKEHFKRFLESYAFDLKPTAVRFIPGCREYLPFTVLIVGEYEKAADFKELMATKANADIVWKKFEETAMYNPAVAAGVFYYEQAIEDDHKSTRLRTFMRISKDLKEGATTNI